LLEAVRKFNSRRCGKVAVSSLLDQLSEKTQSIGTSLRQFPEGLDLV
jgi:hypothetical protein